MIEFYNEEISLPEINFEKVIDWITKIVEANSKKLGSITYIFCSDNYILQINKEYLNHDYFTDIITFNYNEGENISGDIFISLDTVADNAKEYGVTYNNELLRVIIHGVLHLVGYNDKTDEEQEEMTQKEDEALNIFKF